MADSIFTQMGSVIKTEIDTQVGGGITGVKDGLLDAMFTGTMSGVTYDTNGNITGYTKNNLVVSNIVYNTDGNVASLTETITIDTVETVKNFTATYNTDGNITAISETA